MTVKNNRYNEDLDLYDSDIAFMNEVLDDEDLIWDYPLHRTDDGLMKWIVRERIERSESLDILGANEDDEYFMYLGE